jgi:hypothetical protein
MVTAFISVATHCGWNNLEFPLTLFRNAIILKASTLPRGGIMRWLSTLPTYRQNKN